jgi:hypothetical protein
MHESNALETTRGDVAHIAPRSTARRRRRSISND